jgi:hypothetical protein
MFLGGFVHFLIGKSLYNAVVIPEAANGGYPGSSKHRRCNTAPAAFTGSRLSLRSAGMTAVSQAASR